MERDGDGEDLTPFLLQRTTSLNLCRRLSSIFFSSGLVVILLLVAAVFFLVFVVPSTLSFSAQIFRPNNFKKSWDSLNIVLVLAAVVFGFLCRNNNGDRCYEYQTSPIKQNETQKSNPSTPHQRYDYSTDEAQISNSITANQRYDQYLDNENKLYKSSTMRRTSSSYPDLREFSSNWTYGDDSRRFYDDIHFDTYRVSNTNQLHRRGRSLKEIDRERDQNTKNIYVDTVTASCPKEVSNTLPLPATPAAAPAQKQDIEKPKRTYESVGCKKERSKVERNLDPGKPIALPNTPPPPPPPLPPPPPVLQPKSSISDRNKGGAMGLNSLYHKTKKKQRQRSVDNLDSLFHQNQTPELHFQLPQPSPPPPPPPPPSVSHNIFLSKKSKGKGHIIVTSPNPAPIPPPPPPPSKAEREPKLSAQTEPLTTHKPPELVKMNSFENADENSNSGGESPLMTMPPPPPFFKAPAWKFVVQGDYVDSDIIRSSTQGGNTSPFHPSPAFCPSPDVNLKAESFITNFRAKLKLERVHSMNKGEPGLSNLGPGPGPS